MCTTTYATMVLYWFAIDSLCTPISPNAYEQNTCASTSISSTKIVPEVTTTKCLFLLTILKMKKQIPNPLLSSMDSTVQA